MAVMTVVITHDDPFRQRELYNDFVMLKCPQSSGWVCVTYPVIGTTKGFKAASLVTSISSPRPSAACSLSSADPLIRPCFPLPPITQKSLREYLEREWYHRKRHPHLNSYVVLKKQQNACTSNSQYVIPTCLNVDLLHWLQSFWEAKSWNQNSSPLHNCSPPVTEYYSETHKNTEFIYYQVPAVRKFWHSEWPTTEILWTHFTLLHPLNSAMDSTAFAKEDKNAWILDPC